MGIENQPGEYYRKRAAQMLVLADRAVSDRVRRSYLTLAENWFRLAERAKKPEDEESHH